VLPLLGADEGRVSDDLEGGRLERLVQLAEALFLASVEQAMELIGAGGLLRDLVHIVVKGFGIENRGGDRIILVVQGTEEVVLLQPKFPEGPGPTSVGWIVHPTAAGYCGYGDDVEGWFGGERERRPKSRRTGEGKGLLRS